MNLLHLQNIQLVIFDFDGTIADTSEGILDSHRFTLKYMGRDIPSEGVLRSVIGGNLLNTYIKTFGFGEKEAIEAVKVYRQRYAEVGIHQANMYPGFRKMLLELKSYGFKTGVATLKMEKFAKEMLLEMEVDSLFDEICGMDLDDKLDKADLILKCVSQCRCLTEETLLVGDTRNDLEGAKKAGVNFIGVTYGFGFKRNVEYHFPIINEPKELKNMVIK